VRTEGDQIPISAIHDELANIAPNDSLETQAVISGINLDELTDDSGVSQFVGERTPDHNHSQPADSDTKLPPVANALAYVTDYVYDEERNRQKERWGKRAVNALEEAKETLQKTAWRKDWANETFDKSLMRKEKLRDLNEYIGFISRTVAKRQYRYRSLFFQSFCAAWYAAEFLLEKDDKILKQLTSRKAIPAAAQVLKLLNQLREANNRPHLSISEGGSQ
jgi:hypothetical protein